MDIEITIKLIALVVLVIGGLALFLYGITSLSGELKVLADGDRFRRIISRATSNRVKACAVGTGFTALIQSSGGTYALSIGLVKAGALEYKNAIAIVIGANLGTCITSFLIAIPSISQFMPIVAFVAAFVMMVVHSRKAQQWSRIAFNFSLIFFGIWLMETFIKQGVNGKQWFTDLMLFMNSNPWVGLLFGTAVTLILQSCSAVIGVVQGVFAAAIISGSPLTLFGILPIVIGSNIGAMIPSILSAFGGNAMGKRVALVNGFMKVAAGLLFMGILYAAQPLLNSLNATTEDMARLQIAIFHLIFNFASVLIFLPLVRPMAWASEKIFPDNKAVGKKIAFKELDPQVIKSFPATGIALAKELSDKMFGYVLTMFKKLDVYYKKGYNEDLKNYINELERATDNIDRHLADFLLNAETGTLSRRDLKRHGRIMRGIKDIERIGDYGENLLTFYTNIYEKKNEFDEAQLKEINQAHKMALDLITKTLNVYENSDKALALKVIKQRRDYNKKLEDYQEAYFKRESTKKGQSNYISLIYVDILNSYERVYSHCANIAKLYNNDKDIDRYSKDDKTKFTNMSMRY